MTTPINPTPREGSPAKPGWQSSARWTLIASVGVTVGMFGVFYVFFLRG